MRLYKVTSADGSACHGGTGCWPLPHAGKPGNWRKVEGRLVRCKNGLHLLRRKDVIERCNGEAIWLVEARPGTDTLRFDDEIVVREARLVERLAWNERIVRHFACDCAEWALKGERKAGREPDTRSWDAIRVARLYADGMADVAELTAAKSAAWSAVESAAGSAAWSAAWSAAESAARSAARAWQTRRLMDYLHGRRVLPLLDT